MGELIEFLTELVRRTPHRKIIFLETAGTREKTFDMQGTQVRTAAGLLGGLLVLTLVILLVFTPVRNLIPGYSTSEIRQSARLASERLEALEDSITMHLQYVAYLRQLLTGEFDSTYMYPAGGEFMPAPEDAALLDESMQPEEWPQTLQPGAIDLDRFDVRSLMVDASTVPASLLLPALAPVSGYPTQGFNAGAGHFGVDIATEEGNTVRSIGQGNVVFADWSYGSGYTLIVQHADGFLTVFKHNRRLLKRLGDHVQAREGIAISGNTGLHSTGPHLHFEIWHHGLPQDPRKMLVGL